LWTQVPDNSFGTQRNVQEGKKEGRGSNSYSKKWFHFRSTNGRGAGVAATNKNGEKNQKRHKQVALRKRVGVCDPLMVSRVAAM